MSSKHTKDITVTDTKKTEHAKDLKERLEAATNAKRETPHFGKKKTFKEAMDSINKTISLIAEDDHNTHGTVDFTAQVSITSTEDGTVSIQLTEMLPDGDTLPLPTF